MKISIDSRTIQPGDYFIPVKGASFDGRDFIQDAINKGGRLLDVDLTKYASAYRKKLNCQVIGITGSAGKTTSKDMLTSVLSQKHTVVSTKQNQNNDIGVPLTVLAADDDTDILIVEMAMRNKGEIGRLAKIVRPTHAIITGIGLTHVAQFSHPRDIAKAKSEIFQKRCVWERKDRLAFINYSSQYSEFLKKKALSKEFRVMPFGGQDLPDQNMQLCFTVGRHFGLSDEEIHHGIQKYVPSSHRLISVPKKDLTLIDDTYNANPDGVLYALQYIKRFNGRKMVILGDMLELGSYSENAHKSLLEPMLDAGVDVLFTFGKETKVIQSEALSVTHFNSKEALHKMVLMEIKKKDIILVKGSRGMKMEETVEFISRNFN